MSHIKEVTVKHRDGSCRDMARRVEPSFAMLLDASRRLRLKAKPDSAHGSTSAIELVRHAGTRFALFSHSTWREGHREHNAKTHPDRSAHPSCGHHHHLRPTRNSHQ